MSPSVPLIYPARTDVPEENLFARRLIWLFFWLWVFEGSLRKWILPEFNAALLVVRDPVLFLLYAQAYLQGKFPWNGYVVATAVLGVFSLAFSLLAGDISGIVGGAFAQSLQVTIYGFRTNFLYLPLIWLIPEYLDRRDILRFGWWVILLSVPMAMLVFVQFQSPSDSWINAAAGGEGRQIETSLGKIRPPGTFSYTNGLVSYLVLSVAYLCFEMVERKTYHRLLMVAGTVAAAIMVALSGSRSAVGATFTVFVAVVFACIRRPEYGRRTWQLLVIIVIGVFALNYFSVTRTGMEVLEDRFGDEENIKRGFVYRFLYDLVAPYSHLTEAPLFGYGLGVGTNAGSALLVGRRTFLLAEGDTARAIFESGPILGLAFIVLRVWVCFHLLAASLRALNRSETLPLLIFSAGALTIFSGQIGQPTALGYAVICGGFALAAARDHETTPEDAPPPVEEAPRPRRGRSLYAERLHGAPR